MVKVVKNGEIYTRKQLRLIGLIYTGVRFGGLLIYKKNDKRYLLKPIDKRRFRVYLDYEILDKEIKDDFL